MSAMNRPMIDILSPALTAQQIFFYLDASAAVHLGFGCIFNTHWFSQQWKKGFIEHCRPSIEYLELLALCAGIFTWKKQLQNCRIIVFCDNTAVVSMINNLTSSCPNCMILIRKLILNGLLYNRRVYARYVDTKSNYLTDSLSRLQINRFRKLAPPGTDCHPYPIDPEMWLQNLGASFNVPFISVIKKKHSMASSSTASSQISTKDIERAIDTLKDQRHRSSTRQNYYTILKIFNKFVIRLDHKPTSWDHKLTLFVGHLIDSGKCSMTVKSYVSAIRAVLQNIGVKLNLDEFLIVSLTRACRLKND